MALLAMPLLITNLGCEMLYILEQRLKAQSIPADKSRKVLQDVIRTMFDRGFINETVFVTQSMYTLQSTRKVFDKLVHSSIMRLSESSMDKLFDLMVMGAKYQLLCSSKHQDMLQVTYTHLDGMRQMISSAISPTQILELLDNTQAQVNRLYGHLSFAQLHNLRHAMCRFFQGKRVKVSLFLQEGIQASHGDLVMPSPVAPDVGRVRHFAADGGVAQEEVLQLDALKVHPDEFFQHPEPLGSNLYNKERVKAQVPPGRGASGPASCGAGSNHVELPDEESACSRRAASVLLSQQDGARGEGAKRELNMLAAIVNIPRTSDDNFKLKLFVDDDLFAATGAEASASSPTKALELGEDAGSRYRAASIANVMKHLTIEQHDGHNHPEHDDLLQMMDAVS